MGATPALPGSALLCLLLLADLPRRRQRSHLYPVGLLCCVFGCHGADFMAYLLGRQETCLLPVAAAAAAVGE